jgi:hypothetical protein
MSWPQAGRGVPGADTADAGELAAYCRVRLAAHKVPASCDPASCAAFAARKTRASSWVAAAPGCA